MCLLFYAREKQCEQYNGLFIKNLRVTFATSDSVLEAWELIRSKCAEQVVVKEEKEESEE